MPPLFLLLAAALVGSDVAFAQGSVASKRADAQRVLAQIQGLDSNLSHAIEAYNLANEKLAEIRSDLELNRRHLRVAGENLAASRAAAADQLVALYTGGQEASSLEVLLGATSLEDLLNRLDTADRVADQTDHVWDEVVIFRREVKERRARLKKARAEQSRLVAERAAYKASIESQLVQRRRMLSSIQGEIARIQAAERALQARLAAQARARLASSQALAVPIAVPVLDGGSDIALALPPARYGGVVGIAMQYLGTPYVYGGASPAGFDCSGFIMYVFAQIGVSLPHNAAAQYGYGTPVPYDQLQAGDLVFFNGLGHNGIYIGGGQFIHSPHTGDVVKISSISGWYASTFVGGRRL